MEIFQQKKNYFKHIGILLIFFLIISVFIVIKLKMQHKPEIQEEIPAKEKIEAVELKNPDDCEKNFHEPEDYRHCLTIFAVEQKDPNICDRMSRPGYRPVDDLSECKAAVAINTNDITFCEELKEFDEKDNCFLYFAIAVGDPKLCSKVYQYPCYFNQCLYAIAVKTSEIGLCEEMQGKKENEWCYKEYYSKCLTNISREPIPYLGTYYILIDKVLKVWRNLPVDYGALVEKPPASEKPAVIPGSPADKAGVKEGDIILEIEGIKINKDNDLAKVIISSHVGDEVNLKILREEKEIYTKVILEERPTR